ncbi:MAG: peptidase T4 [Actinomyces sp.]|uniref:peptidase T4 n=1 Tax=Actinomyces sp. TaxID=29317 RepID=UPI0026DA8EB0|nr:peptidase T4 [Actinomyces sp.]MDO4244081.1 peptidase T4 [Actinomyces sp.]
MSRALRRGAGEEGNAPVEFIGWTLILVVPVLYLIVTLAQVQAASFAVASAADAAARVLEIEKGDLALTHARAAVGLALSDQGVEADPAKALSITCSDSACTTALLRVQVALDLPVLSSVGVGREVVVLDAERSVNLARDEQ